MKNAVTLGQLLRLQGYGRKRPALLKLRFSMMNFSRETLFRKCPLIAAVLVNTFGVTLVMKDSLPSFDSDILIFSPLTPRRMQLQRWTGSHSLPLLHVLLDSWASPCVLVCSFVMQVFSLMLKIFLKPGGIHGMLCIPWLHWRGWSAATQTQGQADLDCCTWLSHPFFSLLLK